MNCFKLYEASSPQKELEKEKKLLMKLQIRKHSLQNREGSRFINYKGSSCITQKLTIRKPICCHHNLFTISII